MDVYIQVFGIILLLFVLVFVRVDCLAQMSGNLAKVISPHWPISHLETKDN